MNAIHLKKGFSPPIAGAPSRQLRRLDDPRHVGMVPEHIPFIKPRLLVQEGDPVAIGTPLFEDKRNTRIRSPLSRRGAGDTHRLRSPADHPTDRYRAGQG
jgi:Na+-transporting NADH:ubiquinone oxidoreductase subunit NqrA